MSAATLFDDCADDLGIAELAYESARAEALATERRVGVRAGDLDRAWERVYAAQAQVLAILDQRRRREHGR